jgi:hypothetical protein
MNSRTRTVRAKPGRHKLPIDGNLVEGLAAVGCTSTEIAAVAGCSHSTISRRFAQELAKGKANLEMRLRKKQVDLALAGNVAMCIWLGKVYLGQTEKQEITQKTALRTYGPEAVERARRALRMVNAEMENDQKEQPK